MIKVIRSQTRPNMDTNFFKRELPKNFQENLKTKYIDTGKLIRQDFVVTDDKLTFYSVSYWKSIKDFLDYTIDEDCHVFDSSNDPADLLEKHNLSVTIKMEIIND